MLGGNLGSLLYGDVSVMVNRVNTVFTKTINLNLVSGKNQANVKQVNDTENVKTI